MMARTVCLQQDRTGCVAKGLHDTPDYTQTNCFLSASTSTFATSVPRFSVKLQTLLLTGAACLILGVRLTCLMLYPFTPVLCNDRCDQAIVNVPDSHCQHFRSHRPDTRSVWSPR